jgi:hypothetical protein
MNVEREGAGMEDQDPVDRIHSLDEGEESPEDRALRAELQSLPLEAFPARDLWSGIEARMQPRAGAPPETPRKGLRLSWGQAAAAGVALMLLSGSLVWVGVGSRGAGPERLSEGVETPVQGALEIQMATARDAFGEYDLALGDLRRLVEEYAGSLEPGTVEVLEENLAAVEAALLEARQALLADPSAGDIGAFLSGTMRRRLTVLRAAVSTAMAQS